MLGQIVFYTLSDADLLHFGALREPVRVAVITEDLGDGAVALRLHAELREDRAARARRRTRRARDVERRAAHP